ncbi:hypothetical protein [Helicobacter suis]|uniref:hypothetical protein n=1 Tax=Helicobacter suis TaxID=104628 RepID=UPI0013D13FA5|nr:hypothetical protein [Helicobacter suis]
MPGLKKSFNCHGYALELYISFKNDSVFALVFDLIGGGGGECTQNESLEETSPYNSPDPQPNSHSPQTNSSSDQSATTEKLDASRAQLDKVRQELDNLKATYGQLYKCVFGDDGVRDVLAQQQKLDREIQAIVNLLLNKSKTDPNTTHANHSKIYQDIQEKLNAHRELEDENNTLKQEKQHIQGLIGQLANFLTEKQTGLEDDLEDKIAHIVKEIINPQEGSDLKLILRKIFSKDPEFRLLGKNTPDLEGLKQALESQIATLNQFTQTNNSNLWGCIQTLQDRYSTLQSKYTTLQTQKDALDKDKEELEVKKKKLEKQLKEHEDQIKELQKTKGDLEQEISTLKTTLKNFDNKIKELDQKSQAQQVAINTLEGEKQTLEGAKKALETQSQTQQSTITNLEGDKKTLEKKLESYKSLTPLEELYHIAQESETLLRRLEMQPEADLRDFFFSKLFKNPPFVLDVIAKEIITNPKDSKLLAFFEALFCYLEADEKLERLNIQCGSRFDPSQCQMQDSRQNPQKSIKQVLFQGYKEKGKLKHKSVVVLDD